MKVLIILTDKGWQSDVRNALISTVEVDMSCNSGLFYCSPDFSISVRDIVKTILDQKRKITLGEVVVGSLI